MGGRVGRTLFIKIYSLEISPVPVENCIVESRDVIRANSTYIGSPDAVKIVIEKNDRYAI